MRDEIEFYGTGPDSAALKRQGFTGAKVPLPCKMRPATFELIEDGPREHDSIKRNVAFLAAHRKRVGDEFALRVDCWMSLTVGYTISLICACKAANLTLDCMCHSHA